MTHKLFTSVLLTLLLMATVVNGALAASRAASHVGGTIAAVPPCHRAADAGALAQIAVNPCDTLCAGSAPEVTQDHPPGFVPFIDIAAAGVTSEIEHRLRPARTLPPAHHHPPPISPYQRDRRLLI
jgi:hypothetical protein